MTVTIRLPWKRPPVGTLNEAMRSSSVHVKAAGVAQAREAAGWAIRAAKPPRPAAPVHVTLHYRVHNYHRLDSDSLAPTLKLCLDALVDLAVLADDDWQHVRASTNRIHPPTIEGPAMWLTLTDDTAEATTPPTTWHGGTA